MNISNNCNDMILLYIFYFYQLYKLNMNIKYYLCDNMNNEYIFKLLFIN